MSDDTQTSSPARIDRRLAISREAQSQILELYAAGIETRSLAERFGVQDNYIRKLASRHGVRKGRCLADMPPQPKKKRPLIQNAHLAAYKAARRGFTVPPHLEVEYTRLLIRGYSRREAASRLNLIHPKANASALFIVESPNRLHRETSNQSVDDPLSRSELDLAKSKIATGN